MTLIADVFPKLGPPKKVIDKCLKNPHSEDPYKRNMVNHPKHCYNLDDGNFILFVDHCENNSVVKSPCYCYAKS